MIRMYTRTLRSEQEGKLEGGLVGLIYIRMSPRDLALDWFSATTSSSVRMGAKLDYSGIHKKCVQTAQIIPLPPAHKTHTFPASAAENGRSLRPLGSPAERKCGSAGA